MCISDLRLGRLTRTVLTQLPILAASFTSFPGNRQRIGWRVLPAIQPTGTTGQTQAQIEGITFACTSSYQHDLFCHMMYHGDLPTKPFQLKSGTVDLSVCIWEMILPEEVLEAEIKKFYGNYNP
jgi:hypothetical protein